MHTFSCSVPAVSVLLAFVACAGAKIYDTRFNGTTWDNENWRLINTDLVQGEFQSRLTLANGYLGINVAAAGPFYEVEHDGDWVGWPEFNRRQTFATISGFWDSQNTTAADGNFPWLLQYGGESVISGVPHWSGLLLVTESGQVLNASVPADQITSYSTVLDMGAGVHTWRYTWTPQDEPAIEIEYTMYVHKLYVNQASVRLQVTPSRAVNLTVVDVLDGDSAVRTNFVDKAFNAESGQIWTAVSPKGLTNVTAYIYSVMSGDCEASQIYRFGDSDFIGKNDSSIAQAVNVSLAAEQTAGFVKHIGGASSDAFANPQFTASEAAWAGSAAGFTGALASHVEEWETVLPKDAADDFSFPENGTLSDDENIIEQQILAVTNPFHLLSATISANATLAAGNNTKLNTNSISVCGLGSDCYAGQVFWDADVWMAPGLAASHPYAAQQIANYRVKQHDQAKANIKTAYQSSQNQTNKFSGGAVFSWTSGRFGNCTSTGPCFDYQYHLNGDIGLQLYNYWVASADQELWNSSLFPIYDDVAYFYAELLTFNSSTKQYDLLNATDPDEYANQINNPGFTLPLIQTHLESANEIRQLLGLAPNDTWADLAPKINIPINQDVGIIVEYDGMNGSVEIKQADVTLLDDIVNYPNPYSLDDLEFYASKQSPDGPGMTYASYSIVSNEVSPSGCSAYTYNIYGSRPYVRGPWYQFSEQLIDDSQKNGGTHPAYPFLTGMGGANRVAVFGYLGLRLMMDSLNLDPQLPPQISNINYRTIYWQGHAINATSNQTHTIVQRLPERNLATANSTYNKADIPITIGYTNTMYSLPLNESAIITNRRQSFNLTLPGNVAQCQPVYSEDDIIPGQFALAAVDGAISTTWQPANPNDTTSITVDLSTKPFARISRLYFDWAQAPPKSYSVRFSNATSLKAAAEAQEDTTVSVTSSDNVEISHPYDEDEQLMVRAYVSNTTNVTLDEPVWSGRYATLIINGTQSGNDAEGATVAEWAIIGEDDANLLKRDEPSQYVRRPRRDTRLEPLWRW